MFLRVGSANYAAKVWVNGTKVADHLGGHLPFAADITARLAWDRPNLIAISVENKQLIDRLPPGPGGGGGGVAGVLGGYPRTTYDLFPYAGLHRPVMLYSVPAAAHIDDVTVVTTIDGKDRVVGVQGGPDEWLGLFDVVGINRYYGWYVAGGRLDEATKMLADELDAQHKSFGKPIVMTECGTDALPGVHN